MSDREDVRGEVIGLVRAAASWAPEILADDVRLGRDGLGFDSVRMVELLIACEDRFGVAFPAELATNKLSIADLVDRVLAGSAR